MENVSFWYGLYADYQALQVKDASALYFITDKNVIYKGTTLMTDRYSITVRTVEGANIGIRLTDKITGTYYDLSYLSTVQSLLNDNLSLRFYKGTVSSNVELLYAIQADEGYSGTGSVNAGTVYRVEAADQDAKINFDPIQNGEGPIVAQHHDLIVALYDLDEGYIKMPNSEPVPWKTNRELFAVIPTDLVNLVTASGVLASNSVILGAGGRGVKALSFNGALKILRTNTEGTGVEWVSPETVQNVISWEQIPAAQ